MKSVIVTGANGFIGRALLRLLNDYKIETFAVTRKGNLENSKLPFIHQIFCNMENINQLPLLLKGKEFDTFFHLAWEGSSGETRKNYQVQLKNAKWTVDAVSVAKEVGCNKFVGAGTLAELDVDAYAAGDGNIPRMVSCYGSAKLAAHFMSKAKCGELEGISHCWGYLSNVYGMGDYSSNFINFAINLMLKGAPANFTAGEQLYDFISVEDAAQGLYCIGKSGKSNAAYYIGSGHPMPLKNFIKIIRDVIDPSIPLHLGVVPFQGNCLPETAFSCKKIEIDTGYRAKIPFDVGIKQLISWMKGSRRTIR